MVSGERRPLLWPTPPRGATEVRPSALKKCMRAARTFVSSYGATLSLLLLPHLTGLMQAVQVPAEVDAIRSISCAHYYWLHPRLIQGKHKPTWDDTSCVRPEVEQHFSWISTHVTFSVVLANFVGMLVYGRLFQHGARRWMSILGFLGCALARIPFLVLPLYQFPILAPDHVRRISPQTMLLIYWGCSVLSGLSGSMELITLMVESLMTDVTSPEKRSNSFRQLQIANLLGASTGPMLGSFSTWLLPNVMNRCIGYRTCQHDRILPTDPPHHVLFNNTPYWFSFFISVFGLLWCILVVDFSSRRQEDPSSCTRCDGQQSEQQRIEALHPPRFAWLGAFQRLIPVRLGPWSYDARIAQFTVAEIFLAMTLEGPIVLILVMGYVFQWGRELLSIGLTVSNTLRLLTMAVLLPWCLPKIAKCVSKPDSIAILTQEQLDMCISLSREDIGKAPKCCPTYSASRESQVLQHVSQEQRSMARLWRAQVDLEVSRVSIAINALSWLAIAAGVTIANVWVTITGAILLTLGNCAQPLLRSSACTISDNIVDGQRRVRLPVAASQTSRTLPDGADSYLVVVSTVLLPCLLLGLAIRNYVYTATVARYPGNFFLVVACMNAIALGLLCAMRPATRPYRST
ncbi:transmembrane transporter [Malassezia pachydermatis]